MMNNYNNLLEIENNEVADNEREYQLRLKRLIMGYYATQHFFRRLIKSDYEVADVGCYYGQWSYPLLELVKRVDFIDHIDVHFEHLKKLMKRINNAELIVHNFVNSPLLNKQYDLILCLCTICSIPQNQIVSFLDNMLKSLKPGGRILLDVRMSAGHRAFSAAIVNPYKLVLALDPNIREGSSYKLTFLDRWKAIASIFIQYPRFYARTIYNKLKKQTTKVQIIQDVMNKNSMRKLDFSEVNALEEYEICRDIEAYCLRNTFIGNYFWIGYYEKPR